MTTTQPLGGAVDDLVAVVPAGGIGSRLWPLSQPDRPKFLLDLLGTGQSLLQGTLDRIAPLTAEVMVVTGVAHAAAVGTQLPGLPQANILTEPSPRDSMAAIALAAAVIEQRHGTRIMGSFPADHVMREPEQFRESVRIAVDAARTGKVVVIGIEPTGPSPAYGYIHYGDRMSDVPGASAVQAFTEKPDVDTASRMLAAGGYAWNAGMYVTATDVLLAHLERLQPTLYAGIREIAADWDGHARAATLERLWPTLTRIAIDHAIAEPVAAEGGVAVVAGSFDWHDVGDFESLASLVPADADGVTRINRSATVSTTDAQRTVVMGGSKPIAVVGLDDVVVVESDEAILVLGRSAAQRVKDVSAPQ
ncbi:MAG: mannose-1-phosphate guanylyltransferase [Actinobacteria bacterium HGW-Actinobacteria-4]|nr:MAG: mannose-1-phosphate guanylyltransferase [Actinobacteria bacterium HGW-Actinobacteria-4]